MRRGLAFFLALTAWCAATGCVSATSNDLAAAQADGPSLARKIIEQCPPENSTLTGVLRIRAKGKRSEIPVRAEVVLGNGAQWQSIYETMPGTNAMAPSKLVVTHNGANPNRYELDGRSIAPEDAGVPFAGTDFWLSDLGLEFFHWPEQRIVKKEFSRNRACTVLESVNPSPKPGSYTRVVSWIDQETGGIVHAEAYDGKRELKEFDPKEFKKVNGQWQLQEMQIENLRTDSRTRLEFNLDSK